MRLQACVNGARRPVEHPALPVTAMQLADDVRAVVAAGADGVHLHVKDEHGADTLDGAALAEVLTAVRAAAPATEIGVTTGAWAAPEAAQRVRLIRGWTLLPDVASVNWHEPGADDVAAVLLARGVGVEAGLWHAEGVAAWLASPLAERCTRALIELPDGLDDDQTRQAADRLLRQIEKVTVPVLLHGEGSSCWPALREAGRRHLATRIGLEDVLLLPDGGRAHDNADLVTATQALLPE